MKTRTWTDDEMRKAISESGSISQTLAKLGLRTAGGNYNTVRDFIARHNMNTTHFHGQLWSKGKTIGPKRPLDDYLSNRIPIRSHNLKNRLLSDGIKNAICEFCGNTEWMGQSIPLELDHIDGNRKNNTLNNVRLLCPNCHALTPTYRGRKHSRDGGSRTHKDSRF